MRHWHTLEVSNRHPDDTAAYPDVDLAFQKGPDGRKIFTRKNGAPHDDQAK